MWVGKIYPTTYFMNISRGAFTKALGFRDLMPSYWPLAASIPVLIGISWLLLKKQEE
jgi:ribosome-dependent ATPase